MSLTETKRTTSPLDREGFAMVTTLLVVLILSVLAVGAAWIAGSEKKTAFNESVHVRSVYAADAGGESAINFIRLSELDVGSGLVRNQGNTGLVGSQSYDYSAFFLQKRPKPGWGMDYLDYDYRIDSRGSASQAGDSGVELVVSRLFKEGY